MKQIPISNSFKSALVDDEDYLRVKTFPWYELIVTDVLSYAQTNIYIDDKRTSITLHRFILNTSGTTLRIDHRNRDGLDCQRANLRIATRSQNGINRSLFRNNNTGFKGVRLHKLSRKFEARITCNGVTYNLGLFDEPEIAAITYDNKALQLFGEFAWTNFGGINNEV